MDFGLRLFNKTSTSKTNIIPCVIYNKQQAPTGHGSDSKGNAILKCSLNCYAFIGALSSALLSPLLNTILLIRGMFHFHTHDMLTPWSFANFVYCCVLPGDSNRSNFKLFSSIISYLYICAEFCKSTRLEFLEFCKIQCCTIP